MKRIFFLLAAVFFVISSSPCFAEQTLVLTDGFDGSISDNWTTGRAAGLNPTNVTFAIDELQTLDSVDYPGNTNKVLIWDQEYDYIETKATYGSDVMVTFDVWGPNGTRGQGDFWIELTALTNNADYHSGIFGFRYGALRGDSINIGRAPDVGDYTTVEGVTEPVPSYFKDISTDDPREGTVSFICNNGAVQMRFEDEVGGVINSDWVPVNDFTTTKIRIWGYGGSGSERAIDNVRIYAPSGSSETSEPQTKVVVIPMF